jgi:uncharacterized repeat protein (TIGR03803 family)
MHSKQQLIRLRSPSWFFASLLCSPLLAADVEKVLYSFTRSDGSIPYPALILDAKGNLYGTAIVGGASGVGAVFELIPSNSEWTEKMLHSFNGQDGAEPFDSLIFDAKRNLYGTTAAGSGAVCELTSSKGTWTVSKRALFSTLCKTRHRGMLARIHANSANGALLRLTNLALRGLPNQQQHPVERAIRAGIDTVVHLGREQGRRYLCEILECSQTAFDTKRDRSPQDLNKPCSAYFPL